MLLTLVACSVALCPQVKTPPAAAPTVDRSAESALKAIFAGVGQMRDVHLVLKTYHLDTAPDRYDFDNYVNLWVGSAGRYRLENSDIYGGAGKFAVSDGMSTLVDQLNDDGSIKISKPLAFRNIEESDPMYYLLDGQAGFDGLVLKDQPVKFVNAPKGMKAIELHSKGIGKVVVFYREGASVALPIEMDEFTAPSWSDDAGTEYDKPYTREIVSVVGQGPFPSKLFSVTGPKGKTVIDERTKK